MKGAEKELKKRFTDNEVKLANEINILTLAQSRGYNIKKMSGRSYKIPGYGGLFIRADGTKWNWFSRGAGGGPIQFLMELEGLTWVDAVKDILGIDYDALPVIEKPLKDMEEKIEFVLPKINDTYKHGFAYLIKTRKINYQVVQRFVNEKKIYEDDRRNIVFVGYDDEDTAKFASVRGTGSKRFRKDIGGSDKGFPFTASGSDNTLLVFESAIDLMSYMTLYKIHQGRELSHHMISMGGTSYIPIENYLKKNSNINKMILCLDSDKEGRFFSGKIKERFGEAYEILKHVPRHKDFNEDLVAVCEALEEDEEMEL
jgi:hypothetical protein